MSRRAAAAARTVASSAIAGGASFFENNQSILSGMDSGQAFAMIVVFLTLILIILVVLYIVYIIKTQNYNRQIVLYAATSMQTSLTPNPVPSTLSDPPDNAATYSFWFYLNQFIPQGSNGQPYLIWLSSTPSNSSSTGANSKTQFGPIVFMDYTTNRMYMSFYLNDSQSSSRANVSNLADLIPSYKNVMGDMRSMGLGKRVLSATSATGALLGSANVDLSFVTIPIDYVPLNRWVHFAAVVQQNAITIYQDGDVYGVRAVSDLDTAHAPSGSVRPLFDVTMANRRYYISLMPPGLKGAAGSATTNILGAYMSSFTCYNYTLNQKDIKSLYSKGPHATSWFWSTWFGVGYMRFQSPITFTPASSTDAQNVIPSA